MAIENGCMYTFNGHLSSSKNSSGTCSGEIRIGGTRDYNFELSSSNSSFGDPVVFAPLPHILSLPELHATVYDLDETHSNQLGTRCLSVEPALLRCQSSASSRENIHLEYFRVDDDVCPKRFPAIPKRLSNFFKDLSEADTFPTPNDDQLNDNGMPTMHENTISSTQPPEMCLVDSGSKFKIPVDIPGTFCQSSPYQIEMEVLILPMIMDYRQFELRIPASSINPAQRKVVKHIAQENGLLLMNITKCGSKYILLRKTASLIQKQADEQIAKMEARKERERLLEEQLRLEQEHVESSPLVHQIASIQTMTIDINEIEETKMARKSNKRENRGRNKESNTALPESSPTLMNAAARRKAKRLAERKHEVAREKPKKEMAMQTCPDDWIICPWCTKDIPPAEQCGHVDVCRAGVRQIEQEARIKAKLELHRLQTKNARRRKQNKPLLASQPVGNPRETQTRGRTHSRSRSRQRGSRSRTRSVDANLSAALKRQALVESQLKAVHPNDLNAMLQASRRLCAVPNCTHMISSSAGGPCAHCKLVLCPQHRPAHVGHLCTNAPQLKITKNLVGPVEAACGDSFEERRTDLKQRIRERRTGLAELRRR